MIMEYRFRELHPKATSPPNIQSLRGFMEWIARKIKGRIENKPIPDTLDWWRRTFQTAWQREHNYSFPKSVSETIHEVCIAQSS